jgi:hypothetical protein
VKIIEITKCSPNLGLLPEPLAAAQSRPQATPRHHFFHREHLSMDRLVRSSSDPTDTTTSSARVLRRSPTSPSSPARAPKAPHQRLLRPDCTPLWDRICGEPSSQFHLKRAPYPAALLQATTQPRLAAN